MERWLTELFLGSSLAVALALCAVLNIAGFNDGGSVSESTVLAFAAFMALVMYGFMRMAGTAHPAESAITAFALMCAAWLLLIDQPAVAGIVLALTLGIAFFAMTGFSHSFDTDGHPAIRGTVTVLGLATPAFTLLAICHTQEGGWGIPVAVATIFSAALIHWAPYWTPLLKSARHPSRLA